jgi:hypothetical protein
MKPRSLVLSGPQMRNPSNSLPSDGALGALCPLLGCLEHRFPTRGFDNSRLVRLGGVTVAPTVREPLHHDEKKPARPTPPHKQRMAMVEKQTYATATTEEDRLLLALHRPQTLNSLELPPSHPVNCQP